MRSQSRQLLLVALFKGIHTREDLWWKLAEFSRARTVDREGVDRWLELEPEPREDPEVRPEAPAP